MKRTDQGATVREVVRLSCACANLRRAARVITRLYDAALRPSGLSVAQFTLLQALNTGHAGSLSTIHANSASQALARIASCALQSGVEIPYAAMRLQIAEAIGCVVHLGRTRGRRLVEQCVFVRGYDVAKDTYELSVAEANASCSRGGRCESKE